ncbi:MAG: serine/threonine-protein phosphatase [Thermomicrobiales bacterium]|nr:serine/threonine-protein phosphatase [Thermomicrobiales bacterium]
MNERALVPQPESLIVAVGGASDVGGRPTNQDAVVVAELPPAPMVPVAPSFLLAVADGMGGHAGGDVAANLAVETLRDTVIGSGEADAALLLKQAFRKANEAIYGRSEAVGGEPMGTTLTAAILRGKYATIASVGDSRAYLLRARGMTQITKDHSLVAEQVANGTLKPEAARSSPQRNILTQALGMKAKLDTRLPGIFELTLLPGDRLLLCTDGFYDVLQDRDFADVMLANPPASAAARLVDIARERGTTDNVSAVVAEATPTRVTTPRVAPPTRQGLPMVAIAVIVLVVLIVLVAIAFFALNS